MNKTRQNAFFLMAKSECIGLRTYHKIIEQFENIENFYEATNRCIASSKVLSDSQLNRYINIKKETDIEKEINNMSLKKIRMLGYGEDDYPEKLLNIPNPPLTLFLAGANPNSDVPIISVIGARECSIYGENIARRLGELIGQRKINLISGMARGIDSVAQTACIDAGGFSIAVLGGGVDICYPKESAKLYDKLINQGAIISEYVPGTIPMRKNFALRNRIISGLSDTVCVVEAREKSGTLITVEDALNQGKEVYAVPGRITDVTSFGTNELIRQGAGVITDISRFIDEVYDEYLLQHPLISATTECPQMHFNESEIQIIKYMDDSLFTPDQLSSKVSLPTYEVLCLCLLLCEKGILKNIGAGRFSITDKGFTIRNTILSHPVSGIS